MPLSLIAEQLAREGAIVSMYGLDAAGAELARGTALGAGYAAHPVSADIRTDVLVNNPGAPASGDWQTAMT